MRALAFAAVVCLPSVAVGDDGMRCGQWLIWLGDDQATVLQKCGPPTTSLSVPVHGRRRRGYVQYVLDYWTYDRGPSEFVRTLHFANYVLTDVVVGDYGH